MICLFRVFVRDFSSSRSDRRLAMPPTRRRVCTVCGSRRFRLIASQLVCYGGHIQRDFRVEAAQDDDGFDSQITTRSRTYYSQSQRDTRRAEKQQSSREKRRIVHGRSNQVFPGSTEHASLPDPEAALLQGPRAMFAMLECYQLVLRKQVESFRKYFHGVCPDAFEVCWYSMFSS